MKRQLPTMLWRSTRIGLLSLVLTGCVTSTLKPPSGSALTLQTAQDYLDETSAVLTQDESQLTLSDPQELAMRLNYAHTILAEPGIAAALRPKSNTETVTTEESKGILSASLLTPSALLNLGKKSQPPEQSLQRYVESLERLLEQQPGYEKSTFGPDLTLLADSRDRSSERLWDLAAQNLAIISTPDAAKALVDAAATQLDRTDISHYAAALLQQRERIVAQPQVHRQLASALLEHWQLRSKVLSEQPQQARWSNALHQAFLGISHLTTFWQPLRNDTDRHPALLQLTDRRLAELKGKTSGQADQLRTLRQQILQLPLSTARQHSLGRFFPVAYFQTEAHKRINTRDQDAMGQLIIALRLMEIASADTTDRVKAQLFNTLQLSDYRPFAPQALGVELPAGRQQIQPLIRTYLASEPEETAAQLAWIRNVSLLMQGRPQDICPGGNAQSDSPRPALALACAQVLGQQWDAVWSARLYAHLIAHRDGFTPDFYHQLMASLSPAINSSNAATWLEFQRQLITEGSKPRALAILPWSGLALQAQKHWPDEQPRKLAQTALELGLSPESEGMAMLLLHSPLPWLLERGVLQQAPQLPTSLVDRLVQQHSQQLDAAQRARFLPPLLQQVASAPDAQALPAARLARMLAQGDITTQSEVDQTIRSRWLQ